VFSGVHSVNVMCFIDLRMSSHPCIPGIDPTWSLGLGI
jgi:hypothetical protein